MLGNLWEWAKSHIWLSLGLIVGLVILWRSMSGSSSSAGAAPGADPTSVQVASQLQLAAMGYQAQAAQTQAQLEAVESTNAAQITIADMAKQLQMFQTGSAADVAHHQIDASYDLQAQANTLEASVAIETLRAQESMARLQADTLIAVQQSNAAVTQSAIAAQKSIAKQSFFDKIF